MYPTSAPIRPPVISRAPAATTAAVPNRSRTRSGTAAAIAPMKRPRSPQNSARRRRTSPTTCWTRRWSTCVSGIVPSPSLCGACARLPDEGVFSGRAQLLGGLDELLDEPVGVDALGLSLEVQDDPVPESGRGDGAKILAADVRAAVRQRAHLGAEDERLGPPRARPVADEPPGHLRGTVPPGVAGKDDGGGEVADVGDHRHLAHQLAEAEHLGARHHALHRDLARPGRAVDDLGQLLEGGIPYAELEEEAIELRLRQ